MPLSICTSGVVLSCLGDEDNNVDEGDQACCDQKKYILYWVLLRGNQLSIHKLLALI